MKRLALGLASLMLGAAFAVLVGSRFHASVPLNVALIRRRAKVAQPAVIAQNAFGLRLISRELAQHPQGNVLISPLSIWQCGAMAQLGAAGATKSGLRGALSIAPTMQDAKINAANVALRDALNAQSGVTLNVANALWAGKQFSIVPNFTKACQTSFGAETQNLDFASPSAAQSINDWVSAQTQGKISEIIQAGDLDVHTAVCLTNAVYFHGNWETRFDASQTHDKPFYCANGTQQQVPLMSLNDLKANYIFDKTFEGVRLPYQNSTCALWALLPRKRQSPATVLKTFDMAKLRDQHNKTTVNLQLPRFKMTFSDELSDNMKALGAISAFEENADFHPMFGQYGSITKLRHKALIEVDEEGTTAAAATSVDATTGNSSTSQFVNLTFNHPFVVAVVEEKGGALIMMGVVNAPEQLN